MTLKQGSVTTLQFQDDNTLISASDIDGIIKVRMIDTLIALPITIQTNVFIVSIHHEIDIF